MNIIPKILIIMVILFYDAIGIAQHRTVEGTVADSNGFPLPGVNIMVKGTSIGAHTDFEGHYSIETEADAILQFDYVGFKMQEISVGDQRSLDVVLQEDSQALGEVIVTAFGRKMTRNESTANVVSISSEELTKQLYTDATQSLQGKVSGLVINTTTGTPGSASEIRIRGMNSVTASNDPLYIVDGIPVNSGNIAGVGGSATSLDIFSLINPKDIDNISVLKDASAVAPYGADGANGVILITTKTGKKGRPRYSLSLSSGFRNDAVPGPMMATAQQKLDGILEGLWNSYGNGPFGNGTIDSRDDLYEFGLTRLSTLRAWDRQGQPDLDWRKTVTRKNAFVGDVNLSVSQGQESSRFYASLGFNKTEGTVIGSDFQRWSASIKYDTDLSERLNLKLSLIGANADQNGVLEEGTLAPFNNPNAAKYFASPWGSIYNEDGSFNIEEDWLELNSQDNEVFSQKVNVQNKNVSRIIPSVILEYELWDNLSFRTQFGMDFTLQYQKRFVDPRTGGGRSVQGSITENASRLYHYTTQNSLDYHFKWGELHGFRITALQEFSRFKDKLLTGSGNNMANIELNNISGASANFDANSTFTEAAKMRYVGLVNYDFDKRYLFDASYSFQGDSRFSQKYDSFYSFGLGWNLHQEEFLAKVGLIDVLRLKLGYGITGNAGIDRNQYQAYFTYERYNSRPAQIISGFGTDAKWEKSRRMDVSVDFGFFNNRLSGSFGAYLNQTSDMLFNVPLPLEASFRDAVVLKNEGQMRNSGIELNLNGDLIATPDFNWSMNFNISTVNNKVTDLPEDAEIVNERQIVRQGYKVYEWYMPEWAGVNPDNGLPLWYIDRRVNEETTSNYSEAHRILTGKNPLPSYSGSVSTRLDYKGIFIESMLYFSGGNQVYDRRPEIIGTTNASSFDSDNLTQDAYYGAWRQPGDQATYPRFDYTNSTVSNGSRRSTKWLHNGDFMRLRDLAVGYNFKNDSKFLQSTGLSNLSLSVRGSNLYTWVRDKTLRWDPEMATDIVARSNFKTPPVKSITLNVNLNF